MNTKAVTIGEIEPQSVLLEGNLACSETFEEEENTVEIAPFIKSLRSILRPFDESVLDEKNTDFPQIFPFEEEENTVEVTPFIKSLRGVLRPYKKVDEDDELCRLILRKHS